jgi:hypothetical protein
MTQWKIRTLAREDFTGEVCGVAFAKGHAVTGDVAAYSYFRSRPDGYEVEPVDEQPPPPPAATEVVPRDTKPAPTENKPEWVAWAVHNGLSADEADKLTKPELIEKFGKEPGGSTPPAS